MKRFLGAVLITVLATGLGSRARADGKDASAVIDKAIKALGGEDNLKKAGTASWKTKGTMTFQGEDRDVTNQITVQGLSHFRRTIETEQFMGVVVLAGDKGWRKFGDNEMDFDGDAVENEKRNVYLQVVPTQVLPLKGKGFKTELAGEEKVGDKPAAVVKVTGPDGKNFTIFFDKESGLPVKQTATVMGFGGQEYDQEVTFANYKDFDGIKRATKVETKRNGEKFISVEVVEFKVLDKVDAATFSQP